MSSLDLIDIAVACVGFFCVFILNDLTRSVKDATKEISDLNVKIGIIITKHENQEKDISDLKKGHEIMRERIHSLGGVIGGLQTINDLESSEEFNWVKKKNNK